MDFSIKEHDVFPRLTAVLSDSNGPLNLTAATVHFRFGPKGSRTASDYKQIACTVLDAEAGKVEVPWGTSDTTPTGEYRGEFIVNKDSAPASFPGSNYIAFDIEPHLPTPP